MTTFLEFLDNRAKFNIVNEAFNEKNIDKAIESVNKILSKHIPGLIPLEGYVQNIIDKTTVYSKQYLVLEPGKFGETSMFQINFLNSDKEIYAYSIDFFKDLEILWTGTSKAALSLYTLGSSLIYFLPIIWTVATSHDYNLSEREAIDLGRSIFKNEKVKESLYNIGKLKYRLFEHLSSNTIKELYVMEDKALQQYKKEKRDQAHDAYLARNDSEEAKRRFEEINAEYKEVKAAIASGVETLEELKVALKHNQRIVSELDDDTKEVEKEFEEKHDDPKLVFKKMQGYIKMVIDGVNPSIIICGAPGVGKTYRVKQQLKAAGYHENHNLLTIKGKCTPRVLYTSLYSYKSKGDILLIDDADSLVGPHAPEDSINILKGALDSTSDDEGRIVTYGVSGKILDDEGLELPKRFYYNGSVIIITNWNAGKLDTALKGRSFVQDIHFTVEDVLKIIQELMPGIDPEHLSSKSKIKAYDYLVELSKQNHEMEVSIRTFMICAKIFESCSKIPDLDEDAIKSMIKEQMKLQAMRGGKKY